MSYLEVLKSNGLKCIHCSNEFILKDKKSSWGKFSNFYHAQKVFDVKNVEDTSAPHLRTVLPQIVTENEEDIVLYYEFSNKELIPLATRKPAKFDNILIYANTPLQNIRYPDIFIQFRAAHEKISPEEARVIYNNPERYMDYSSYEWIYVRNIVPFRRSFHVNQSVSVFYDSEVEICCETCFKRLYSKSKIPYFDDYEDQIGELTPCPQCYGAGIIPRFQHVDKGICYHCKGKGYLELV